MAKLKYTKEFLSKIVKRSNSFRDTAKNIGVPLHGGNIDHITKKIKRFNINTSHFISYGKKPWNKGFLGQGQKKWQDLLIKYPKGTPRQKAYQIRRAMLEYGFKYKCNKCSLIKWNGEKINLEINHKDGDSSNNLPINLEFLCPNCHSQTPKYKNWKVKPIGDGTSFEKKRAVRP